MMMPSHYVCPDCLHKEYSGYIMAGHYYCIDDNNMEQVIGSGSCDNAHLLYIVGAVRLYVPNTTSKALPCVCSVHKVPNFLHVSYIMKFCTHAHTHECMLCSYLRLYVIFMSTADVCYHCLFRISSKHLYE